MTITKTMNLEDKITFGKYKGNLIQDVLGYDPEYLVWAHNTIKWFKLEQGIYDEAVNAAFHNVVVDTIDDCPFWFEDDNGSWLH